MASEAPWAELGLDGATRDTRTIKRAYAARLKQTRPDDDPQGFARLRTAYERALALAQRAEPEPEPVASPAEGPGPPPVEPAHADALVGLWLDNPLAALQALWQQPRWQAPEAASALARALLHEITQPRADVPLATWVAVAAEAAAHHGWLPPARSGPEAQLQAHLGNQLLSHSGRLVLDAPDRAQALRTQLDHPLWEQLDNRQALGHAWANHLLAGEAMDDALANEVIAAFGWAWDATHPHPDGAVQEVLRRRFGPAPERLLQRVAAGEIVQQQLVPTPPQVLQPTSARLLLAASVPLRLRWADWYAPIPSPKALRQTRQSAAWLHAHVPAALTPCKPDVLRWWLRPRPEMGIIWALLSVVGALAGLGLGNDMEAGLLARLGTAAAWASFWLFPLCTLAGGWAGYQVGRLQAHARLGFRLRVVPALSALDRRWTRKVPFVGAWLANRNMRLVRDVLVSSLLMVLVAPPMGIPFALLTIGLWHIVIRVL